jgi:hypothetical protein
MPRNNLLDDPPQPGVDRCVGVTAEAEEATKDPCADGIDGRLRPP